MQPIFHLLNSRRKVKAPIRMRLVMFGFAGGSITALVALASHLPPWIEVWGAEYPGRGLRWKSDLISNIEPLLEDLLPGLSELCDKPLALFGYSMGAHVAYRLGLRLQNRILGVIAASAKPPFQSVTDFQLHESPDETLVEHLNSLGGIPSELLSNQVIMESFIPVVRADLACCWDMRTFGSPALDCPLMVMHGAADQMVSAAEAPLWLHVGGGRSDLTFSKAYSGGHFFHSGIEETVATDISDWIEKLMSVQSDTALRLL